MDFFVVVVAAAAVVGRSVVVVSDPTLTGQLPESMVVSI